MRRVALLVENDCQDEEVYGPLYVAKAYGWEIEVHGPQEDHVTLKRGGIILPDTMFRKGQAVENYDAVIIPGGWGAERLRQNQAVLEFVRDMHSAGKVVAAICHGPWVLCSADLCKRYEKVSNLSSTSHMTVKKMIRMTCYHGMKDDVINAGADYVMAPVVIDGNVVTSPHYRNVPEFMRAVKELLEK